MGAPAVVMNDRVMGQCPNHLIPNPATGAPQPAPPMPFWHRCCSASRRT